jgi:hypothetical protein
MPDGTGRVGRFALTAAVATALVCATFGAVASSALAWGDSDRDSYTANISPASAPAGQSTTFAVALTNTSSPGSGLASAVITPPLGFRVTGASLPAGASGKVYVIFNLVVLDHLNVAPGSTLHVAVTATAPSRCSWPYSRWFTFANEGGFFSEDLRLDGTNSSLTTPVSCGPPAAALQFGGQPNNALVTNVITGNSYDNSGPPVTVQLVDASNNPVTTSGTPVTIALGNHAGNASLGGTLTENTVNGVATFNDLTLDKPNNHYTLVASSGALTSATSSQFDTSTGETNCNTTSNCVLMLNGPESTLNITAGPNGGQLVGQVDPGTPLNGPNSPEGNTGCAGYTPQNPDWYGFDVINLGDSGPPAKTVSGTFKNTTPTGYKICFGSTVEFQTVVVSGEITQTVPAPAGTLSDGSSGFVGFLAFCDQLTTDVSTPCITDDPLRTQDDPNSTTGEDVIVDVTIPSNYPGDPFFGRG